MVQSLINYGQWSQNAMHILTLNTPWNTVQGGKGLIPAMIQVCDYDFLMVLELSTLIYVRPLKEWQILELGHFEVGNFGQKLALFFGHNDFFSEVNASWDPKLFVG